MKKRKIISIVILSVSIFALLIVNLGRTISYFVDDDGNIITSSFNGEIKLGYGEVTTHNKTYSNNNENATVLWIYGGSFTMDRPIITKNGDGVIEGNYSGTNAAVKVEMDGKYYIHDGSITTNGKYAHALFSYNGGDIRAKNMTIITNSESSSGVMVSSNASFRGDNLDVSTNGEGSHAIFGYNGGTVDISGGKYTSLGNMAASLYANADVNLSGVNLTSSKYKGIIIEGNYSVSLNNSSISSTDISDNNRGNIFMYQVNSKNDSYVASFIGNNNNIVTNGGNVFNVTNTKASIKLTNNTFSGNSDNFINVGASSYGDSSNNGGDVGLDLINQNVNGNIVVDNISKLDIVMSESSSYQGVINGMNSGGVINLKMSSNSKIVLMGDSYISSLDDEDTNYSNINLNGHNLYVNGNKLIKPEINNNGNNNSNSNNSNSNNSNSNNSNSNNNNSNNGNSNNNNINSDNRVVDNNKTEKKDVVIDKKDEDIDRDIDDLVVCDTLGELDDRVVNIINIVGVILIVTSIVSLIRLRKERDIG